MEARKESIVAAVLVYIVYLGFAATFRPYLDLSTLIWLGLALFFGRITHFLFGDRQRTSGFATDIVLGIVGLLFIKLGIWILRILSRMPEFSGVVSIMPPTLFDLLPLLFGILCCLLLLALSSKPGTVG